MPTFVDPNDCTWLANQTLEEELASNPVRPLAAPLTHLTAPLNSFSSQNLHQSGRVRRSKRKKIAPLAYWKNERVVYGFDDGKQYLTFFHPYPKPCFPKPHRRSLT